MSVQEPETDICLRGVRSLSEQALSASTASLVDVTPYHRTMLSEAHLPIPWTDLKRAFHADGSLRDIVIPASDLDRWERVYGWIEERNRAGTMRVTRNPDPLPTVADMFQRPPDSDPSQLGPRLAVFLGNLQINCHFFDATEIEFDLDASEVRSADDAAVVLSFIRGLANVAEGPVHLTEENAHDLRWLTFDPAADSWTFVPLY